MIEVQTWTPFINWLGHDNGLAAMLPATGGMWVRVSDYDAAIDILAQTIAANAALMVRLGALDAVVTAVEALALALRQMHSDAIVVVPLRDIVTTDIARALLDHIAPMLLEDQARVIIEGFQISHFRRDLEDCICINCKQARAFLAGKDK